MPSPTDPAAALRARLDELDAQIAPLEAERELVVRALAVLTTRGRDANVSSMATQTARLHHSRGARRKTGNTNPLALAADKAGHTVRSLAETVGCSAALLSQARGGIRSISMDLAKKIEAVTGFAATPANWPKLRSDG